MASVVAEVYMFKPVITITFQSLSSQTIIEKGFYVRLEECDWKTPDRFSQLRHLFQFHMKSEFPFDVLDHCNLYYTFELDCLEYISTMGATVIVPLRQLPDCSLINMPDASKPIQLKVDYKMQPEHEPIMKIFLDIE